jgi:integrase
MPKLTKRFIDGVTPDPQRDRFLWDDALKGFALRVKPSGARSFMVQYRNAGGRSRKLTLGQFGVLTPEQARQMARQALAAVDRGEDPAAERQDARKAPTMRQLAADYLERHGPKKRPKSLRQDQDMLRDYVLPRLGTMKVTEVSRRDVERLHGSLRDRPYRANRVVALLSMMFGLAVHWGWRESNPARGIPKFLEHKRDRWLSDDELTRLLAVLDGHANERAANAIRLLVLTGARKAEVLNSTWCQFDLVGGVWTKPAHLTKQKRMEHVPLSPEVIRLLEGMREKSDAASPFLFPGDVPGKPLQDLKTFWRSVCRHAGIENARIHDLRHTFASRLVSSGEPLALVGRLMGHTQAATTHRYAHLADDPLRAVTNGYSTALLELTKAAATPEPEEP